MEQGTFVVVRPRRPPKCDVAELARMYELVLPFHLPIVCCELIAAYSDCSSTPVFTEGSTVIFLDSENPTHRAEGL
jgi:hypothetical protein